VIELDVNQFGDFAAVARQISAVSGGSQINLGQGNLVTLSLVGVSELTADNFMFT
jgi:hypothetical protein